MIKSVFISIFLFPVGFPPTSPHNLKVIPADQQEKERSEELDQYWAKLSKTIREGDFEGYKALYHEDAVVIFATGENKVSMSIAEALADWKEGFERTKAGEEKGNVEFRFSQRIGNENTAHETGIFAFTAGDAATQFIHFEAVLVKRKGKWLATMEYQKEPAQKEEWEKLK